MLKQYKMAVIGLVCMFAVMIVSTVVAQEMGQSTGYDNTQVEAWIEETESSEAEWEEFTLARAALERTWVEALDEDSPLTDSVETEEEAGLPDEEDMAGPESTGSEFDGYILPVVDVYLNIRSIPSRDGEIVGKLYVGAKAKIIEELDGWYLIESGTVSGYVNSDYTVTGIQAEEKALEDGKLICTVLENGLRVREEPNTESAVFKVVSAGESFEVEEEMEGWVGIVYSSDTVAYLSTEYVEIEFLLGEAVSIEEELAAIRAAEEEAARLRAEEEAQAKQAAEAASARIANSKVLETIQRDSISATDEEIYLLACLVHMESGFEPYEGQLAVANVVLNRLKVGYGSTISEVIYAKGQFSGANTGALASRLAKGPNESCIQAAVEALSGVNNIGDYRNFLATRIARYDSYSEYTIIGNHCFYKR